MPYLLAVIQTVVVFYIAVAALITLSLMFFPPDNPDSFLGDIGYFLRDHRDKRDPLFMATFCLVFGLAWPVWIWNAVRDKIKDKS